MSELKILCLGGNCGHRYGVRVYSSDGTCVYEGIARNGEAETMTLPGGEYTVRLRSCGRMEPRGFTRWVTLCPGQTHTVYAMFRNPEQPLRQVTFTVEDANYPDIVPMNGGITVMAKQDYVINFTNGVSAPISLPVGKYTFVSTTIPGYENAGTTMGEFEVTASSTVIPIKLSANGVLTVDVRDDQGTAITAGEIELTNSAKTKMYGTSRPIQNGAAVFENMPYSVGGISVYLKQNGSDAGHNPITDVQAATMDRQSHTEYVINERKSFNVTLNVEDENYDGITDFTGNVTVNG